MSVFKSIAKTPPSSALDELVQSLTAFQSFTELINDTASTYRPTIYVDLRKPSPCKGSQLADAYDFAMIQRGDSRRAHRVDTKPKPSKAPKIALRCNECERKFSVGQNSTSPHCPKCGSEDFEVL